MDRRAKKTAHFFVACHANLDTRVKIPDAMKIKGYSPSEAADRSLQMQRREVDKITGEDIPGPPAPPDEADAAASALITLSTTANVGRPALRTITTVPAAVLPSPERKVRKTSHQEQIYKQNETKRKAVHTQAHARATTLVAEKRMKPKENRRTTAQAIASVEGGFRAQGYGVTLSKNTINRYVAHGMLGTFPLVRGYEGMMPKHSFQLLVLAVESFIQISNVNSIEAKQPMLMMAVNTCCGVAPAECRAKHSLYDRVMKSTNVLLNADVCVYLSSGFKGQCFNYAIPIAKSYPPMTSLPYLGLVVLPLRTPRGELAIRVYN